jgi:hypothetical protein
MDAHLKEADKVLLAFTETHQRRFEGDDEVGKGLGATLEGVIVTQNLYKSGGRNAKFRPMIFDAKDARFISNELRCFNDYQFDTPENYDALLRWLYEEPEVERPPHPVRSAFLRPKQRLNCFRNAELLRRKVQTKILFPVSLP